MGIWKAEGTVWFDLFRLACHLLTLAIFLGFLGAVIPAGDSLAIFRIEFTVFLALGGVLAFFWGRSFIPMISAVTVALSLFSLAPFIGLHSKLEAPDFRLHQHNVLYGNRKLNQLIEEVRDVNADILTLQEISETNFAIIKDELSDTFPHFKVCLYNQGGVAVMMRNTGRLIDHGCVAKGRLAWMRVDTELGPVTVVSVHQIWPWPRGQFSQKEILAGDIAALPRPVIMAGDFNNVPWAATVRANARAAGGRLARGLGRSFVFRTAWPRFRIDHVVAPVDADVVATLTPGWGSDHLGVTADIRLSRKSN